MEILCAISKKQFSLPRALAKAGTFQPRPHLRAFLGIIPLAWDSVSTGLPPSIQLCSDITLYERHALLTLILLPTIYQCLQLYFLKNYLLFVAALHLHGCVQAFSSEVSVGYSKLCLGFLLWSSRARVQLLRPTGLVAPSIRDPFEPRIESVSRALAGGSLTTGPPPREVTQLCLFYFLFPPQECNFQEGKDFIFAALSSISRSPCN